jgi:hypothetical protein
MSFRGGSPRHEPSVSFPIHSKLQRCAARFTLSGASAQTPIEKSSRLQAFFGAFSVLSFAPFWRRAATTNGYSAAQAQAEIEDGRWQVHVVRKPDGQMPRRRILDNEPGEAEDGNMSAEAARLLVAFDTLPPAEKDLFVRELFRRLPPVDSGPLGDEVLARAGDDLAAGLDRDV